MSQQLASDWYYHEYWRFNTPSPDAMEMFLKALLVCANGDGELTQPERDWVLGLGAATNLGADVLERLRTYDADDDINEIAASNDLLDEYGRRSFCYFAVCACRADGALEPGEIETIQRMASKAGLSDEVIAEIFELVKAEDAAREKRLRLLLPDGPPPF